MSVTEDTAEATFTCSATSAGGTSSESVTVKRDATAPTLAPTVAPNPVLLGGTATASPNASDNLSDIASASCGAVDTSSVGSKTVSCTATDNAGNIATADASYRVIYNFNGFFSPISNQTINDNKAGSSIPVKFSLSGNQGLNILAAGYPKSQSIDCATGEPIGALEPTNNPGGSSLSYDAVTDQYTYVWKTEKSWKGTCRILVVRFTDGTEYSAKFRFK